MSNFNVAVLISGNGSNLQAIIDELDWEDGTVVEWELQDDGKIALRNIEGIDIK